MNWLFSFLKGDRIIWIVVILLCFFSLLAVYSSTGTLSYKYQSGNTEHYLYKHAKIFLISFVLLFVAHKIKYTYYSRISMIAIYLAVPMLILTLMLGTNLNEASRWITLPGTSLTFQTSDFAKLALLLYIARVLSRNQDNIKDFKSGFLPVIVPIVLVCGFILPANFSTSAVLFVTSLVVMFIGRVNLKYIGIMLASGLVLLTIFIASAMLTYKAGMVNSINQRVYTWINRTTNFVDGNNENNYQAQQAKIAIATGGLTGKGPGGSTQRNFLPHPYSDFIYAIIIEEYGFIGGALVLILYVLLFYRCILIVKKNPRAFATLLSVGCGFSLVFQAMINMAVATSMGPVTGQPLPLLSMGGTSIIFTGIAIGIILSVSRESEREEGGSFETA